MSTNYYNTLILVAEDSPTDHAIIPNLDKQTVASQQYQMLAADPYVYTSDDVIFARVAERDDLDQGEIPAARDRYFATGRACLRASPLPKQYGWGLHHDHEGKVALVDMSSQEYADMLADDTIKKTRAMRRSRG